MISPEEFVERLCLIAADRGPRRFPRRRIDREILMKSVQLLLDSRRTYKEGEVNEVLRTWCRDVAPALEIDHVTLRRLLVDYGELERTADGRAYRVGFPARPVAFDRHVDSIDVCATIAAFRQYRETERLRRRTEAGARQRMAAARRDRGLS